MANFKCIYTNFQYTQNGETKRHAILVPVAKTTNIPANQGLQNGTDFHAFLQYYDSPVFAPCIIVPDKYETQTKALASASSVQSTINFDKIFANGTVITVDEHRTIEVNSNTIYYKYDGANIFSFGTYHLSGYSRYAFNLLYADYMSMPWRFNDTKLLYLMYEATGSIDGTTFKQGSCTANYITPTLYGTHTINDWFNGFTGSDPDPNAYRPGNSTPGGGTGTRPSPHSGSSHSGDTIPVNTPDPDVIDSGFLTVFVPTKAQLQNLGAYLWSHLNELDGWKKLLADPLDVIIGCHVLPVEVASAGTKEIKPGLVSTGVTANYTNKQFVTKNMGSIDVPEYWGSALDFAPYSRVSIFLPFIGMRTLDTDLVMGKTIHLYYQIEVTTGALLAQIEIGGNVLYEFSGNCAMQIPVSGTDYRAAVTSALTLAVTVGAGIASGGAAAAPVAAAGEVGATAASAGVTAATVASIANATVGAVMNSKPSIERTGSLGGAAGYMGIQTPYILIEYPKQSLPKNYMSYNGYPCNMSFTLSQLTGYTQCETVRFKSARATDEERQEIVQFLQAGVILGGDAPTKPTAISAGIGLTGYQCGSEDLVVNKSLTLALATQTIYLKKDTEITRPTIILNADTINFNYAYIDAFDRFYYVTGVRNIGADRWEVDLKVDSLTSFTTDISNANAIVSRQENEWNLYLDDGSFKAYQVLQTYTKSFPTGFTNHTYVLLVSGS